MEQNLSNAFAIMIVGMITVFLILCLVVLIGNVLIRLTNKFWPEVEIVKKNTGTAAAVSSDGTVAAIVAAVDVVTKGKGKITKISKSS